jgi:hypothetical protein
MHRLTKIIGALAFVTAMPSSAGEVTGNGDSTPVANYQAASICSFSGLEDHPILPGTVQSYGMIVRSLGGGHYPFGPGFSCRGN